MADDNQWNVEGFMQKRVTSDSPPAQGKPTVRTDRTTLDSIVPSVPSYICHSYFHPPTIYCYCYCYLQCNTQDNTLGEDDSEMLLRTPIQVPPEKEPWFDRQVNRISNAMNCGTVFKEEVDEEVPAVTAATDQQQEQLPQDQVREEADEDSEMSANDVESPRATSPGPIFTQPDESTPAPTTATETPRATIPITTTIAPPNSSSETAEDSRPVPSRGGKRAVPLDKAPLLQPTSDKIYQMDEAWINGVPEEDPEVPLGDEEPILTAKEAVERDRRRQKLRLWLRIVLLVLLVVAAIALLAGAVQRGSKDEEEQETTDALVGGDNVFTNEGDGELSTGTLAPTAQFSFGAFPATLIPMLDELFSALKGIFELFN